MRIRTSLRTHAVDLINDVCGFSKSTGQDPVRFEAYQVGAGVGELAGTAKLGALAALVALGYLTVIEGRPFKPGHYEVSHKQLQSLKRKLRSQHSKASP